MTGTLYRDILANFLLLFVMLLLVLIPHIREPEKAEASADPPGNIIATISWPEGNTDIDLWMIGPGEPNAVGYSNKGGVLVNLLRDDLGTMPDATPLNYENAYTRGAPAGEYIVNVHCYRCPVVPQLVSVEIRNSKGDPRAAKGTALLFTSTLELRANGQERTAARFRIDDEGDLIPGSIDFTFKELRAMGKGGSGGITPNPFSYPQPPSSGGQGGL